MLSICSQTYTGAYDAYLEMSNHLQYYKTLENIDNIKIKTNNKTKNNNTSTTNHIKHSDYCREKNYNCDVPRQACFAVSFLKKSSVSSFCISSVVAGDVKQAIIEGAYPIQVHKNSNYIVTSYNDIVPKSCIQLESNEGVKIVYCP